MCIRDRSKAKEEGREAVICASTGNTSAAAAAYASRGGLKSYVLIPDGYVAQGKLAQALMYGAEIISIQGNFDKALEIVRELSSEYPINLVSFFESYPTKTVILNVNALSKVMNKVQSISELLDFFTSKPLEKIKKN